MTTMMRRKPSYKRGDVILSRFPDSNLYTAKQRPGLIVQADNLQTGLPQLVVAMITSNRSRANHPSRVTILVSTPAGRQSGLIMDSVVMTDNLATIVESTIERVVGSIPMEKIDAALRHTLNL